MTNLQKFSPILILTVALCGCSSGSKSSNKGGGVIKNQTAVTLPNDDIVQLLSESGQSPMVVASSMVQLAVSEGVDTDAYASAVDKVLSLNCNHTICVSKRK